MDVTDPAYRNKSEINSKTLNLRGRSFGSEEEVLIHKEVARRFVTFALSPRTLRKWQAC
jgi:hypothetical protein